MTLLLDEASATAGNGAVESMSIAACRRFVPMLSDSGIMGIDGLMASIGTGKVVVPLEEVNVRGTVALPGAMSLLIGVSAESLALALREGFARADICNGEAREEDEGVGEEGMNCIDAEL